MTRRRLDRILWLALVVLAPAATGRLETRMDTRIEQLFNQAVESEGPAYLKARQEIIQTGAGTEPFLEQRAADADWRVSLVSEALLGWIRSRQLYEQVAGDVRGTQPPTGGVKPVAGRLSASGRARKVASHGRDAVPRLLEMLLKSHEYQGDEEREIVLAALGLLRDRRATLPLLHLVTTSADEKLRTASARTLGRIRDSRAAEPLLRVAQDRARSVPLRSVAVGALGEIGAENTCEALTQLLTSEHETLELRRKTASALGTLGDHHAVPALIRTIEGSRDEDLARMAVESLGEIGDTAAVGTLKRLEQGHTSPLVREAAARARQDIEKKHKPGAPTQPAR